MTKSLHKTLTLKEYQIEASRTFLSKGSHELDVLHCLVGLQTEIGELADPFKKGIYYGKPIDKTNVAEEMADAMWYLVNLARLEKIDLEKALVNNIDKLQIRFPEKFTAENAIVRNLEAERVELEK